MVAFPEYAKVDRIVAKENFYDGIDTATKNLFQSEIARIVWGYKLAPETINLPKKKWPEIEVFRISLKNSKIPEKVLKAIDSAIPYPILFLVEKGSVEKAVISYKEQSQKNENFAKVDAYFSTGRNDPRLNEIKIDGLDIDTVFSSFVRQIAGDKLTTAQESDEMPRTIKEDVEALKGREKIQKQIDALTRKINAEPSLGERQELAEERFRLRRLL